VSSDAYAMTAADLTGMGVRVSTRLTVNDKISPLAAAELAKGRAGLLGSYFVVEFHSDVDLNEGRGVILNLAAADASLELFENPDLNERHLMIHVSGRTSGMPTLHSLAARDEVAYIFPASQDLIGGQYVVPCQGAVTANGNAGQLIATFGEGWDGP